ncbi:hypothetical protein BCR43DRAFT_446369, partial [Syncephalastrum racemosum]
VLGDEHRSFVIDFIDEEPTACVADVVDALTEKFDGLTITMSTEQDLFMTEECRLSLKRTTLQPEARNSPATIEKRLLWAKRWAATDLDFVMNCVFIDEAAFSINLRRSYGYTPVGKKAIVETKTTRAMTHTIRGAICAAGVV